MRAACGVIMVCLARSFSRIMAPPAPGFPFLRPLLSGSDEKGFFSCKMNGLYRELQAFIRCLGARRHDGIFAFCRAGPCPVGRTDPGRVLPSRDAHSGGGRGPAVAVLDAGARDLARAR